MTVEELLKSVQPSDSISALRALGSEEQVAAELRRKGGAFGAVACVVSRQKSPDDADGQKSSDYFVCFERTQDAMAASKRWHCFLYGLSSVAVSIAREPVTG